MMAGVRRVSFSAWVVGSTTPRTDRFARSPTRCVGDVSDVHFHLQTGEAGIGRIGLGAPARGASLRVFTTATT